MATEIIGPSGEHSFVVLLDIQAVKLPSYICYYVHRLVQFSTLIRETYYSRQWLIQRLITAQRAQNEKLLSIYS